MYGNGAGTGLQKSMIQRKKVAAIQRVPRRVAAASFVVVVGSTPLTERLFLVVATTPPTAAATFLVSGWCVPVLNKTTCCVKEQEYSIVINDNGIQQVLRCKTCVTYIKIPRSSSICGGGVFFIQPPEPAPSIQFTNSRPKVRNPYPAVTR